ncbi:MAG: hypothetical protein EBR73_15595 [Rhodobacteraceae bacterium]|jgi:hypothetical protein|nr:hypothetical protein [Paracoccaceae bacterium]
MDFFLDNSAALIAASEARHAGGSYELSDAHAAWRRASDDYAAQKSAYKADPTSIEGERLDFALRRYHIAQRALAALGGEV